MRKFRKTYRKELIERMLTDKPILLEELRWRVLIEEYKEKGTTFNQMGESHLESFARTVRNHMPGLRIYKLPRPDHIQPGIVARAAVYRIREREKLDSFLRAEQGWICWNYADRQESGRVTVGCFLLAEKPGYLDSEVNIRRQRGLISYSLFPVTAPLSLVARRAPLTQDLNELASIPWPLYRQRFTNRTVIVPQDPKRRIV